MLAGQDASSPSHPPASDGSVVYAGADIGSTTTKVVLLGRELDLLTWSSTRTGARPKEALAQCWAQVLAEAHLTQDAVAACITTGYGRYLIGIGQAVTEITCHARGIHAIFPRAGTILEVGGQDSKAIAVNVRGEVVGFAMNDRCAAGTGRFLEVMARVLEVALDDIGPLSLKATAELPISSTCTVFAESEVVSHIASGREIPEILAGVHASIARRLAPLVRKVGVHDPMIMSGGCAYNPGLVKAVEKVLGVRVVIPPEPLITGALGAAILAAERATGARISPGQLRSLHPESTAPASTEAR